MQSSDGSGTDEPVDSYDEAEALGKASVRRSDVFELPSSVTSREDQRILSTANPIPYGQTGGGPRQSAEIPQIDLKRATSNRQEQEEEASSSPDPDSSTSRLQSPTAPSELGSSRSAVSTGRRASRPHVAAPMAHLPVIPRRSQSVYVNVYDLDAMSARINRVTRNWDTGAYHAGVEVYGSEYSFGQTQDSGSGITRNVPRKHPVHIYRETVYMGNTFLTQRQVRLVLDRLIPDWRGDTYHILRKNCVNFADHFCCLLGVGSIPDWIRNLQDSAARTADTWESTLGRVQEIDQKIGISSGIKRMTEFVSGRGDGWQTIMGAFQNFVLRNDDDEDDDDYDDVVFQRSQSHRDASFVSSTSSSSGLGIPARHIARTIEPPMRRDNNAIPR